MDRLSPRCGADIVEGREAFGCAKWDDGCAFRVAKEHRGAPIGRDQVRELAARGVVLRPIYIEGAPRILCWTAKGELFDLEMPSRDAQRGTRRGQSTPRPQNWSPGAAAPTKKKPAAAKSATASELPACPQCQRPLMAGQKGYGCSGWQQGCRFVVWKQIAGKKITPATVRTLVEKGKTRLLKGFSDGGREFSARLVITDGKVVVEREQGA